MSKSCVAVDEEGSDASAPKIRNASVRNALRHPTGWRALPLLRLCAVTDAAGMLLDVIDHGDDDGRRGDRDEDGGGDDVGRRLRTAGGMHGGVGGGKSAFLCSSGLRPIIQTLRRMLKNSTSNPRYR